MARLAFLASGPTAVLEPYKKQRAVWQRFLRYGLFLMACVFLGLMNGFLWVMLPAQLFLVFAAPLGLLLLLVIWALPDVDNAPVRWVYRLLLVYLAVSMIWPAYLALQISGLPWISLQRLSVFPLAILFVLCYSVSAAFRAELSDVFSRAKWPLRLVVMFTLVQLLTIFWSVSPAYSISYTLRFWLQFTICFFAAAWVFVEADRTRRFLQLFVGAALVLTLIAGLEWINQGVLWANHIPSFLQVENDALVNRYVTGSVRDGSHRSVGPFPVSLSLAEILAIASPFVLHQLLKSRALLAILLWGIADLALLGAIELTQSRLGTLGWVIAHAVYGCLWGFRRWQRHRTDIVAPAVSLLYPLGVVVFFIGMFTVPAIRNRTIGGGSTGFSDQSRLEQFAQMWPKVFSNPFGYGGGNSGSVLGYFDPGGLLTVDSYVITILLDHGVLGLALFAALLVYLAVKMIQVAWSAKDNDFDIALPLGCAFIVMIEVRLVLSQQDNHAILFTLMGLGAAVLARARRSGLQV
jgi:hypothetical protein